MQLVVIVGRVALYISLDVELLVELLKEEPLVKSPTRRMFHSVYIPPLRHDAILYDPRVGNERIDTPRCHDGRGVTVTNGRCALRPLGMQIQKEPTIHIL